MFHSETDFSKNVQEPLCIYDLRDKLLTLQKIGCTPRILNALNVKFDRDMTIVDLLEEFPCIEGLFISSNTDGWQFRGMRKLTQMKDLIIAFDGHMEPNQLRLPRGIRNIHILPTCITNAENISDFLIKSLPGKCSIEEGFSLTLDMMELVYNWESFKIPKTVVQMGCTQRRNLPRELLKTFKENGFYRGERTEDMVIYRRGSGTPVETPEKDLGTNSDEERFIDEDAAADLILKIIKEAFQG